MHSSFVQNALTEAASTLNSFLADSHNIKSVELAIQTMVGSLNGGGRIISCGNGGSLCDAMHFAEELTGRFRKDRTAIPAMAIADPAHMSCVANDFGYDHVFERFVQAWGNSGDVLLAISTSGNSKNVILATKAAKEKGMKVIGLLGKDGGALKDLVDCPIIVSSRSTDRIQEIHIKLIHVFIEGIERAKFPEHYIPMANFSP
ncbi:MAG: D-sedoheptulose 7-phosphate isomerase [Epsilonproteobacteria bacterium]|nr:MAG: D-sedoheptulose 7-phosphate isomerase [Campylobacterota bacterium]RLA66184.1 MAG: D-sedoheptulose 7-phosphate isomerase [Campylobacterota bacterium]